LANKRLINIDLVEISFAFVLHFTKTIILNFITHLSNLYYIMSDVKRHVNPNTSILGSQYTMAVTFDGSFFCLNVSFWAKFTRNVTKWQVTNTDYKSMIKQCKYSWKPVSH